MAALNYLQNNGRRIQNIIHLSNINFKNKESLLNEQEQIIIKFYTDMKKRNYNNEIVVICGNIFSEGECGNVSIDLCKNLLCNISKLMPIFIVLGPHDNVVRSIFQDPNIYIFEQNFTGEYVYNNIKFGSFLTKPTSDDHNNICIDNLPYEKYLSYNKDDDNYELVLLGGHSEYKCLNDANSAAYSGNFVQQGFYDDFNNHGYIVWPIGSTKALQLINIQNDYAYLVLQHTSPNTIDLKKYSWRPLYPNILVKCTNKDDCEQTIKTIFPKATRVIYVNKNGNLEDDWVMSLDKKKLVQDFLNTNPLKKQALEYYDSIITKLNYTAQPKKVFALDSLHFGNMFNYSSKNYVNFKKAGIIGIDGLNAAGKSSIINIILYLLYDKYTNNIHNSRNVLNSRKKFFFGALIFNVNGVKYKAVKYKTFNSRVFNFYYMYKGTELVDITKKTNSMVSEEIIGSLEILLKTSIIKTEENFVDMTELERIDFLSKLYGITIFDSMYDFIKDDMVSDKLMFKILSNKLKNYDLNKINSQKLEFEEKLCEVQKKIAIKNQKLLEIYLKLSKHEFKKELDKLSTLNEVASGFKEQLYNINSILKEYDTNSIELAEITYSISVKRTLSNAVAKKGLVVQLLDKALAKIEDNINQFLSNITNFKAKILPNTNIEIIDNKNLSTNLSGYQNFILSLAIRYALLKTSLFSSNFMIIDEGGFSTFDHQNIQNVGSIFDILREKIRSIFVISHIDDIKKEYNTKFNVTKKVDGDSYISSVNKEIPSSIFTNELEYILQRKLVPKSKLDIGIEDYKTHNKRILFIPT